MTSAKKIEGLVQDKKIVFESGWLAKQANGAVMIQMGETQVFVAATAGGKRDLGFMPLMVDYREKAVASGKFPGGFMKRESRPGDHETLISRLTDRPIRPLFPEGWIYDTQVLCQVWSYDDENPTDVLVLNGASAALHISDIPWAGPVGSVRVGRVGGNFVANPTTSEQKESDINLIISGTREGFVMVEAGMKEVPEADVLAAFEFAQGQIQNLIDLQDKLREAVGKEKKDWGLPKFPEDVLQKVREGYEGKLREVFFISGKQTRSTAIRGVKDKMKEALCPKDEQGVPVPGNPSEKDVSKAWDRMMDSVVREYVLQKRRSDGRGLEDIRAIDIQVGLLARTHGSALFTRGETQAIVTTTLGTKQDEQIVDGMAEEYSKRFMLHYNFPPFSVGETKPIRGPGRREIGHGGLAERALEPLLPSEDDFPYTVRVVSDILESNGSSSMATVCGGTLAMMDAGVPIRKPVAGIAMGLVYESDDNFAILTDILGSEDAHGDMDFKVAGSEDGITALQMDLKAGGIPMPIVEKALAQAKTARLHVIGKIQEALAEPRKDLSRYAPRLVVVNIDQEKIGLIIGPGGKTIRAMEEESGANIEIDDDGKILISSKDLASLDKARDMVKQLTEDLDIGGIFKAKVVSIKNFGAFVGLEGRADEGLVHVTEITDAYVDRVEDYLERGMPVEVKLLSREDSGKYRFSIKAARQEKGEPVLGRLDGQPPQARSERGGGERGFRDSRPRGGRGGDRGPRR